MVVCPNCFADRELKGFVSSSTRIGDCEICGSIKQPLLDVSEILDFFQELIDNLQLSKTGVPLIKKIQSNWCFFNNQECGNKILDFVLPKLVSKISSTKQKVDYIDDILDNFNYWEKLKKEIKWNKRFISNTEFLVQELGWDGFFNTQFEITPKDELFRARIHSQSGIIPFSNSQMLCPSPEFSNGGRANPSGIPYLYLSDNSETVLYEIRASYLDELSVGTFHLKDSYNSVKIVDFTEDTPLFQSSSIQLSNTIKAKHLRAIISNDLSKPMRRYDSEIEYIPTQFICEFIKVYTGAEGIRFGSSLHPKGKNIVIFNQELMECKSVTTVKINKLKLKGIKINR